MRSRPRPAAGTPPARADIGEPSSDRRRRRRARRGGRGQGLVEFALVAPVLLLLLLITIDFGRLFVGWIGVNNMARVGANYAAMHPEAWQSPGAPSEQAEYQTLMRNNGAGVNCTLPTPSLPPPSYSGTTPGTSYVTVGLTCDFHVMTPLISAVVGNNVRISTSSVFPISGGCIANCAAGPGPTSTPTTPTSNCRALPNLVGLAVAGARNAWVAAGFSASNYHPSPGADDTKTVSSFSLTPPADADTCPSGQAFFLTSVTVELAPQSTSPPTPGCLFLPNLKGMTVSDGRAAWSSAGFTGTFTPTSGQDAMIITDEVATPSAAPGDCVAAETALAVTYTNAPAPPPAQPCKVPSLVNTSTSTASATWSGAGFVAANLTILKKNNETLPYLIGSQTLVGGTYVPCSSSMSVSSK